MREFKVGDFCETDHSGVVVILKIEDCPENGRQYMIKSSGGECSWTSGRSFIQRPSFTSDLINHPAHYAGSNGIECIDAMRATLTADEFRGYCKGAAFKYIWRERQKGGNESLAKAVWYLNEAQK